MRIIGPEQRPLDGVYLALSDEEARELIGMLEELQTDGPAFVVCFEKSE